MTLTRLARFQRPVTVLLWVLLPCSTPHAARAADEVKAFTDPAPPEVHALPPAPVPGPQKNPDATFHAAPKSLPAGAATHDWVSFLGPTHNAVSTETKLLATFPPAGPSLVWEMNKGTGYCAPAVLGERLVLFHRVGDDETVECLNALTGERYWKFQYPSAFQDRYGYSDGPRASPVIAADSVYIHGAEGKLHCLDLQTGRPRWKRDLMAEFKLTPNFFGVGASPLAEGDKLIVNVGAPGGPCVAAFDLKTGKMVWGAGDQWGPSYATPVPATVHGRRRVFVFAGGESAPPSGGLLCLDPADGKIDFTFPWRGRRRESVNAASPLVLDAGGRIFISESYGAGGTLLELSREGGVRSLWANDAFGTHFNLAVHKDGHLYGVDGHGPRDAFLVCVNVENGREVWRTQPEWQQQVRTRTGVRQAGFGTYRCWLMPVEDKFLCLGEFGHLLWVDLSPEGYRELSRAELFLASETWAPPVLSRGLLYICQNSRGMVDGGPPRLLCYDLRAAQ